ncbi:MAG: N-acetylmuramoyl-L-alanine amidase [Lachnospiraceae bacterium]|nr:N-acetylmuramoyl-L-alanine amidase [Lachnospiraceae bacterium]
MVKYTDPQLEEGYAAMPRRIYTCIIWTVLLVLCMAVCLAYSFTKPVVITNANVSDEDIFDMSEMIPLTPGDSAPAGMVIFSVPDDVQASDIVTENMYNERKFLVHIRTESDSYYGSVSSSGVPIDAGRISGDGALVEGIGVVYDRSGVLLIFDMSMIYEYSLTMEGSTVTMEAVDPSSVYEHIVIIDPEECEKAAGVAADVAARCSALLYEEGIRVYMTDPGLSAEDRVSVPELMEETGADIYIRLGVSEDGEGHHGIRAWYDPLYYIPGFGSIELSEACLRNVTISASDRAIGIFEAPEGSVLYEISAPATYITLGNADDTDECGLLVDDSYRDRLSEGLYLAVTESFNMMGEMKE